MCHQKETKAHDVIQCKNRTKSPYSKQIHKPVHCPAHAGYPSRAVPLCCQTAAICQQEHARAHLAWCSHPVAEDLGVQPRKEHQAYDPVCVAQGAAPQQQVGHVQGIPAAVCLDHCPLKDIQPAVTTNHCLILSWKAFDCYCFCYLVFTSIVVCIADRHDKIQA